MKKHMLHTLDFTISEHWTPFNSLRELSLVLLQFVLSCPSASFVSCPSFSHNDRSHYSKDHSILHKLTPKRNENLIKWL